MNEAPLIDVVNEPPPQTTPVYGAASSGYDWIARVFEWAHLYGPHSILMLNDYNNIDYAADNTIDIVNKMTSAGYASSDDLAHAVLGFREIARPNRVVTLRSSDCSNWLRAHRS